LFQVNFGPPFDFDDGGDIAQKPEKNDGQSGLKRLGFALFRAWSRHVFDAF